MARTAIPDPLRFAGWTGRRTLHGAVLVLDLTVFVLRALSAWFRLGGLRRRLGQAPFVPQVLYGGVDALPVITLLALATGFIVTYRLIALFDVAGTGFVFEVLVDIVALELCPIITAIVFISRSGSAIAVDLANMKLFGDIRTLEMLGIDLDHYAIAPRMVGAALAQLGLAVYFTALTLGSGMVLAGLLVAPSYLERFGALAAEAGPPALLAFVLKNLLFGLFIGAASCWHALRVDESPTEVPRRMQDAVVTGLILVFLTDGLFAVLGP